MQRRTFVKSFVGAMAMTPLVTFFPANLSLASELGRKKLQRAIDVLDQATASKQVESAVLYVQQRDAVVSQSFGKAASADAMFLLGSITKPINIAAVMKQFDEGKFALTDRVKKYLPKFTGDGRDEVTIGHLLTHTSGLPDQVADNAELRKNHAPLGEFAEHAMREPLGFAAGSQYGYSSMGILLATRIAEIVSGADILTLVAETVLQPLEMKHSVQGLGAFEIGSLVRCQMDGAAPESGGGDPTSKEWDWNSAYWRKLGAPWGGLHASAPDIGRFLAEFLYQQGKVVKPATALRMTTNQNPRGLTPRGLGFDVGPLSGSKGCSENTFGHTGSTGTLCWADPASETICVVLTSLPRRAVQPHPRELAADQVALATET